jgi:hypothetical protein
VALNLAGAIVVEAGLALPGEADVWTPTPRKLADLSLGAEQWDEVRAGVLTVFARQRRALA